MDKQRTYGNVSDIQVYRRLLSYVAPFWIAFLISILGFLIYSVSNVAFVQLLSYIIDSIDGKDPLVGSSVDDFLSGFLSADESLNRTVIPVAMVFIAISRGVGSFFGQYFIVYVSTNVVHSLRCELFNQLLKLPSSFYDKNALGHLVARVTYHVTQVTGAATDAIRVIFREGFTVTGYVVFMLYLNWRLTLIFFLVAPLIALLVRYAGRRFRKISERIQNSMGDVTHVASETIQGHRVVRAFGGTNYERERFHRVSNYNRQQTMKMAATQAINSPAIQFLVATVLAALVWLVLEPRLLADMTAGKVIAFISTAGLLAKPIRQLANVNATIQRGLAAAKEIFDLFDESVEEDSGNRYLHEVSGEIEFRHVSFRYDADGPEVLKDISFIAKPGQRIALVGRSGSGKSTLASLIPRFYTPTQGEILIDKVPIHELALENLREHIAT
jgi:subfamily B ATP-binding cassette protein MsbA